MKLQRVLKWVGLCLCFALLVTALPAKAEAASATIYVSASGSDTTGNGSETQPYASLAKAASVTAAGNTYTIVVLSDLTSTACARFYDCFVTIKSGTGGPYTVTRGDTFAEQDDNARSWYNPAMLEAGSVKLTGSTYHSTLRLENIIFDDAGKHAGTTFKEQSITGGDNTTLVQDAIVASYNGSAIITLGSGAVLRNFGGMSAVRLTGNPRQSKLVMESGSVIEDTMVTKHHVSERARVVWSQGGYVEMQKGSVIRNIRDGSIVIWTSGGSTVFMDGEIYGMKHDGTSGGNAINMNNGTSNVTVGPNGYIHDNEIWYGTVYVNGLDDTLDIYGTIENNSTFRNRAGGVAMSNNGGNHTVTMHDGAKIIGNYTFETGGGIMVAKGLFRMKGGTIANNTAEAEGGGVFIREEGQFIMEGGSISNNATGKLGGSIAFGKNAGYADLKGGSVSGGMMNATVTGNSASGGTSNDISVYTEKNIGMANRYVRIGSSASVGNPKVYFQTNAKTVSADGKDIDYNNASDAGNTAINAASAANGWGSAFATLWMRRTAPVTLSFGGLTANDDALPVYAVVIPVGEDGNPVSGAKASFYTVAKSGTDYVVTVPATGVNGSVIGLVQPTVDYGSLKLTGPTTLHQDLEASQYIVSYEAVFTLSENLQNMITQNGGQADFELTFTLDDEYITPAVTGFGGSALTQGSSSVSGNVLTLKAEAANVSAGTATVQFTGTLPAGNYKIGDFLETSGLVKIIVDDTVGVVASNLLKKELLPASIVIVDPEDAVVNLGETAVFESSVQGGMSPYSYQWQIDRNDGRGFVNISQGQEATYTTSAVERENHGYRYRYVVTDSRGTTVTSNPATLFIVQEGGIPPTGDTNHPLLCFGIMLLALGGMAILGRSRKFEA